MDEVQEELARRDRLGQGPPVEEDAIAFPWGLGAVELMASTPNGRSRVESIALGHGHARVIENPPVKVAQRVGRQLKVSWPHALVVGQTPEGFEIAVDLTSSLECRVEEPLMGSWPCLRGSAELDDVARGRQIRAASVAHLLPLAPEGCEEYRPCSPADSTVAGLALEISGESTVTGRAHVRRGPLRVEAIEGTGFDCRSALAAHERGSQATPNAPKAASTHSSGRIGGVAESIPITGADTCLAIGLAAALLGKPSLAAPSAHIRGWPIRLRGDECSVRRSHDLSALAAGQGRLQAFTNATVAARAHPSSRIYRVAIGGLPAATDRRRTAGLATPATGTAEVAATCEAGEDRPPVFVRGGGSLFRSNQCAAS